MLQHQVHGLVKGAPFPPATGKLAPPGQNASREEREGLRLRYFVGVYGQAPPLVIFGPEDNLSNGPVPYGAPTHKDMLYQMTPQEFRSPPADLGALVRWLMERANKK